MYVRNGIAYAGEPEEMIRVKSVRALEDYKLWVRFSNDEQKIFNFKPYLSAPVFAPLNDIKLFCQAYVDYGVVVWEDGAIDIAPERLYADGVPYKNEGIA